MLFVLWLIVFAITPTLVAMLTDSYKLRDLMAVLVAVVLVLSPLFIAIGSTL